MKSTTMNILLCLLAGFPVLKADNDDPFNYDWKMLRTGGMVFAGILCVMGIVILLIVTRKRGGKCKCKPKRKSSTHVTMAPKQPLAGASEC